jgi:hypothetical protein
MYCQAVFAVKYRKAVIQDVFKSEFLPEYVFKELE